MNTEGRHLLAEYWGCDPAVLNDPEALERLLRAAAEAAGAVVLRTDIHRFSPHGVSGVVVIRESHLSVHTWPEAGYAAVDFYTCGDGNPDDAYGVIRDGLSAARGERMVVHRGLSDPAGSGSMRVAVPDPDGGR